MSNENQVEEINQETIKEWYSRSDESVDDFIKKVGKLNHTYDSIVHAVAAAAVKAAWQMNDTPNGGITGFQAGAVMWEFIKNWMSITGPARLIEFEKMLYPQYSNEFQKTISPETFKYLQEKAKEKILENKAHPEVRAHWQLIIQGKAPFDYTIKDHQ